MAVIKSFQIHNNISIIFLVCLTLNTYRLNMDVWQPYLFTPNMNITCQRINKRLSHKHTAILRCITCNMWWRSGRAWVFLNQNIFTYVEIVYRCLGLRNGLASCSRWVTPLTDLLLYIYLVFIAS